MRLIDADDIENIIVVRDNFGGLKRIDAPTIEAEPVKHGKWRISKSGGLPTDRFVCSECNGLVIVSTYRNNCMYNYCPNCGARMGLEEDE